VKPVAPPLRGKALPPLLAARPLDQARERIRCLHYSLRTEEACVHWARAYVRFHACARHPADMGAPEVEAFLTRLANERHVFVATHQQALSALISCTARSGTGLRVMEALRLRVKDVDFERRAIGGGAVRSPLDALLPEGADRLAAQPSSAAASSHERLAGADAYPRSIFASA
jgi:integrase